MTNKIRNTYSVISVLSRTKQHSTFAVKTINQEVVKNSD